MCKLGVGLLCLWSTRDLIKVSICKIIYTLIFGLSSAIKKIQPLRILDRDIPWLSATCLTPNLPSSALQENL